METTTALDGSRSSFLKCPASAREAAATCLAAAPHTVDDEPAESPPSEGSVSPYCRSMRCSRARTSSSIMPSGCCSGRGADCRLAGGGGEAWCSRIRLPLFFVLDIHRQRPSRSGIGHVPRHCGLLQARSKGPWCCWGPSPLERRRVAGSLALASSQAELVPLARRLALTSLGPRACGSAWGLRSAAARAASVALEGAQQLERQS